MWVFLPTFPPADKQFQRRVLQLVTLKEGIMEANSKGHTVLMVGDLNARIGGLTEVRSEMDMQLHPAEPPMPLSEYHAGQEGDGVIFPVCRAQCDVQSNTRGKELM